LDEIHPKDYAAHQAPQAVQPTIALLPGSRKQEISYLLPEYMKVAKRFPNYTFQVAALRGNGTEFYNAFDKPTNVEVVYDKTYSVLENATAAIVTSGTATLETALLNVPEMICYKGSWISYQIAKRLVKGIRFIGIVNLIMDREVVKEFIQDDVTENKLAAELERIINSPHKQTLLDNYAELRTKLGERGASSRVAKDVVDYLTKKGN
jgi:lipid-A-disaccharide synthase